MWSTAKYYFGFTHCLFFLFGYITSTVESFNFDLPSALHQFNEDSLGGNFGLSVSSYMDQGRSWVLVGAPFMYSDRTARKSGVAYRCIPFKNACQQLPFRNRDNKEYIISEQGMGTTVASSNKSWNADGVILACAPRLQYEHRSTNISSTKSLNAIGACYTFVGGSSNYVTINPCISQQDMGSCLAGLSVSIGADPVRKYVHIALGMPGSFLSEGNVFLGTYRETGEEINKVMLKMRTSDWSHKGYALGYSVVLANLLPLEKTDSDVVTASPMWVENEYRGVIIITDKNMQNEEALIIKDTMGHVGSFFGHSLAALDLNGDSVLDLVVGAPYYSASGRTDVGRVYILYGVSRKGRYAIDGDPVVLEGPNADGRFGHALENLGDIDGDGLADLGVGCPYCGNDARGAVFIYLSRRGGMVGGHADQVIDAASLLHNYRVNFTENYDRNRKIPKAKPLSTFGWSLSAGADWDSNLVPDLAIGSRKADTISVIRGKSIGRLMLLSEATKIPKSISLDHIKCGKITSCRFSVSFTLRLSTWPSKELRSFPFEFKFDFDSMLSEDNEKRIRLVEDPDEYYLGKAIPTVKLTRKISISRQPQKIDFTFEPLMGRVVRNRWQPVRLSFRVRPLWSQNFTGVNDKNLRKLPLILHFDSLSNYTFPDISIKNRDCESNVCQSDIFVQLKELSNDSDPGVVYLGAFKETREFLVSVKNRGEPAYNSRLLIRYPKGVHFRTLSAYPTCQEIEETNSSLSDDYIYQYGERTTVECTLADLMRRTTPVTHIRFAVKPSMAILNDFVRRHLVLRFTIEAVSQNPDVNRTNNIVEVIYNLRVKSRLQLDQSPENGKSVVFDYRNQTVHIRENQIHYADTIGPRLRHAYRLTNFGPSTASEVEVNIKIPLYSASMQQLLYILPKVKIVNSKSSDNSNMESVSTLPKVVSSDGTIRGQCNIDNSYVNPYKLRVLETASESSAEKVNRHRRSANQNGASMSYERKSDQADNSYEASTQRGSFLSAWKSRQIEEVRCDRKDSQFGNIFCALVRCTINNLTRNEVVHIMFEARLWAATFFSEKTSDVAISTEAGGRVAPSLDGIPVSGRLTLTPLRLQQTFIFHGIQNLVTKQIPWWPILVAAFLGLILLGLIIVIMWKCGFFKRHRPVDKEFAM